MAHTTSEIPDRSTDRSAAARSASELPSRPDVDIGDVIETVKAYARQETIEPLKGAGRWLAFGAAGAFALGLGLLIVLLGALRLVQAEWDRSSTGSLSWLAYAIVLVACAGLLALTLSRIKKDTLNKEPR